MGEKKENSFQKWYQKNKHELAERRRKKYAEDEDYRNEALKRSRRYYWMNKRRASSMMRKRIDVEAVLNELGRVEWVEDVVTDEEDVRCGMPVKIPVYGVGLIPKYFERTSQTIRLWFLRGYLPEPTYRNAHGNRIFTEAEFQILLRYRHWLELSSKSFARNPFFLKVEEEWGKLGPEGIEVMSRDDWRLVDKICPWCHTGKGLQYLRDGFWTFVPCFECFDPVEKGRLGKAKKVIVRGECPNCSLFIEEEIRDAKRLVLLCPRCGTRVQNFQKERIGNE